MDTGLCRYTAQVYTGNYFLRPAAVEMLCLVYRMETSHQRWADPSEPGMKKGGLASLRVRNIGEELWFGSWLLRTRPAFNPRSFYLIGSPNASRPPRTPLDQNP
jgi:hypothetical protein